MTAASEERARRRPEEAEAPTEGREEEAAALVELIAARGIDRERRGRPEQSMEGIQEVPPTKLVKLFGKRIATLASSPYPSPSFGVWRFGLVTALTGIITR